MTYILIGDRVINLMAISTVRLFVPEDEYYETTGVMVEIIMISGERIEYSGANAQTVWDHLSRMATPMEKF